MLQLRGMGGIGMPSEDREISLKAARNLFAGRPHINTIRRWCERGIYVRLLDRYVILHSFLEGGRRYTTLRHVAEFKRDMNGTPP